MFYDTFADVLIFISFISCRGAVREQERKSRIFDFFMKIFG